MYMQYGPPPYGTVPPPYGVVPPPPPPAPPVMPNSSGALSVVTASPVPLLVKREIRANKRRSTLIFSVFVALLLLAMVFNGIYSLPDGSFSSNSLYGLLLAAGIALIWRLVFRSVDKKTPEPTSYDMLRINEVYEQGVMSTGPLDRVVIPFDEVTAFVETKDWLALYGKKSEIVWLSSDLTPQGRDMLFSALAAHLPPNVFMRRSVIMPCKPYETMPPTIPFDPPVETFRAQWSVKEAVKRSTAALLNRAMPMFFLMSMVLANVLCDSFRLVDVDAIVRFSVDHFATQTDIATFFTTLFIRFLLMVAGTLVCAGVSWLLVAWEKTAATKAANREDVRLLVLEDGVRVQDGADFTVIPREGLHYRRNKNGTVCILLGDRVLTVPYTEYSGSTAFNSLFKS